MHENKPKGKYNEQEDLAKSLPGVLRTINEEVFKEYIPNYVVTINGTLNFFEQVLSVTTTINRNTISLSSSSSITTYTPQLPTCTVVIELAASVGKDVETLMYKIGSEKTHQFYIILNTATGQSTLLLEDALLQSIEEREGKYILTISPGYWYFDKK